jgi:hypothetical protein
MNLIALKRTTRNPKDVCFSLKSQIYFVSMPSLSTQSRVRFSWLSVIGIVCVALVLMSGMIQVMHSHANGQPDNDCPLCVTAHQAIQIVALVSLAIACQTLVAFVSRLVLQTPRKLFFFKLACRPPPAETALA